MQPSVYEDGSAIKRCFSQLNNNTKMLRIEAKQRLIVLFSALYCHSFLSFFESE